MKIALFQTTPADGRIGPALTRAAQAAQAAARAGAQMLIMPELFLPGYNRPDLHATLAQPAGGPWVADMAAIARDAGVGLVFGWAERAAEGVYNVATALGADGAVLAHYRKIQLFGPMERAAFRPGTAPPPVFAFAGRRIGLLICYDIEFPGHAADLARRGADMVVVPTANPAGFEHVQEVLVPARAYENRLTVAYANYCGAEAGLAFGGRSVIVGPDARPIAAAGHTETLLIADIPPHDTYPSERLSTQAQDFRSV